VQVHYCRSVRLVHRGGAVRAQSHFVERVKAEPRISTVPNATVEAILGGNMVESARIRHGDGRVEDTPCAGVFAYIGLAPGTDFLPAQVEREKAEPSSRSALWRVHKITEYFLYQ